MGFIDESKESITTPYGYVDKEFCFNKNANIKTNMPNIRAKYRDFV